MAVLALSMLVIVVDTTIVNIAIPTLAGALRADPAELEWIIDAYTLAFAALLLPAGSLGDRIGRHRALAAGLAVFGAASLGAALSSTAVQLIAWRAVMGAGAALVMPATMAIMTGIFPDATDRARAVGIWSGTSGLGVAIGPTAGGWLLTHFSWGSIFAVNLPVVAVALIAGYLLIPAIPSARPPRFDPAGTVLAVAAFGTATYTIIDAAAVGWLSRATAVGAGLSVILIAALGWQEVRSAHPMMDLSLFGDLRFTVASGAIAVLFFGLSGSGFMLTQIYQFVLRYTPLGAGLRWLPPALVLAATVPAGTWLAARIGIRAVVTAGLLSTAAGLMVQAPATGGSGYPRYLTAAVIMAAGTGLTAPAATQCVLASLVPSRLGVGSAMNNSARNLGAVLGVAVAGSIAAASYAASMAGYPPGRVPPPGVPGGVLALARHSVGAAADAVGRLDAAGLRSPARALQAAAGQAFVHGASAGVLPAAILALMVAAACAFVLPDRLSE
jgi:EmrB/QacA subfamily drug resistance transporter